MVSVRIGKWDVNRIPTERPRGGGLRPDVAHVLPAPPLRPAPSQWYRVRQRSREPSRLPRLPRSKGPGQTGKPKAACAHRLPSRARTALSPQGAGKRYTVCPRHRSLYDWLLGSSLCLPLVARGRSSAGKGRGLKLERGALSRGEVRHWFGARESRARAGGTRAKVLRGAAGGAETPTPLQKPRPAPAVAPAAVSAPRALREPPTPRLLQRCA